jgi:hypothetical protein
MEEGRGVNRVLGGNLRERDHWEDTDVVGRIIFRWIFNKWDVGIWTRLGWVSVGTCCVHL